MVPRTSTSVLSFLLFSFVLTLGLLAACSAPDDAAPEDPEPQAATPESEPEPAPGRDEWHKAMLDTPKPKPGCFKVEHPSMEWEEVECGPAPEQPILPSPRARDTAPPEEPTAEAVGNGHDWVATVSGNFTSVTGSFDSVDGVTSLTDKRTGTANSYTLQLNSDFFTSPACSGDSCQGWQQFIYVSNGDNSSGSVFIQYWMLNYSGGCPSGWITSGSDCYRNSNASHTVPAQSLDQLANMALTGSVVSGGSDTTTLAVGSTLYSITTPDSALSLADDWQAAEFNIFGNCCMSTAVFNDGSTLDVRLTVHHGATSAPGCKVAGYTGETNNLNMVATSPITTQPYPTMVFKQTNSSSGGGTCQTAAGSGD